ncbi:hypothetical protein ACFQPG_03350 [Sphingomonas sp. GCM10030256]|uniref:hypothetical protein n=1 Tax=Sphingomonas sp. GCM10030256 TaxID=3273427 RepID=UPI00362202E1
MATAPDLASIVGDPAWLCHRYDEQTDSFHYRRVERARHRSAAFLIDADLGPEASPIVIRRRDAAPLAPLPGPLHFIFHSAFCASTMLVRALDIEGAAMGLSEPVLLNDMVGWRRRGARPHEHAAVMADALRQLARPWAPGEAVVLKPSNVFNGLAAGALALSPGSRAILLAAPLPVFLASVARKGLDCRLWVRELLEGLLQEGMVDLGFQPSDYLRQTDLQVAAVGWLAQQALFARILKHFGPDRIATLDSERLTGNPAASVAAAAAFLGLGRTQPTDYAAHPALGRDSKSGIAFAPGQRQADQRAALEAYRDEIEKVAVWAEAVATAARVPLTLPAALA